jgi:cleavage and polyadenylation specificity factor subunit 1
VETELEKSIKNVLDFKFLYGYLEPTVAILYEPVQTFVGRLAHRKDTVSLIVISLDLHQKTYPVLYKVEGLPYNCTHIESVPAPLGGVLIFSHNAIIHLDQTHTPGFAAIVNPFFDMESHFKATPNLDGTPVIPVKNKPPSIYVRAGKTSNCKELGVSLDGSHSTFLSPDIVLVILKTGEMLQVDLIGDDNAGRSWKRKRGGVKDIKIKKLGLTTSSPSCITPLADFSQFMKPQILSRISVFDGIRHYSNYFFVGSIVSDAMLIQYFQPIEEKMHDGLTSGASQDVDMLDEELDEELYGGVAEQPSRKDLGSSVESSHFKFKVCDSILVTGPIRNVAVGKPAPYTSNEYTGEPVGAYLEVVACGGYDAHGSLLVMHETVRPQIISSFPLGDADDIWSVRVSAIKQAISEQFHKYLVISRGSGTSILRTGEELEELENSGFYVEGPTVCVGTALNESVIIQVYPNGVIILSEGRREMIRLRYLFFDRWKASQ